MITVARIKKLTNVTLDSEKDIQAARKAYDALTDLQKKLVDNYDVLTAAETKLAMLKAMGKVSKPCRKKSRRRPLLRKARMAAFSRTTPWMITRM